MNEFERMDRRQAIKWILAASAALSLPAGNGLSAPTALAGYGTDPNLMQVYKPGDLWPLTFSKEQLRTVAALCDIIIPADEKSPGASDLKVQDFIDEWISAPYPRQQRDRVTILKGLKWLDAEASRRFGKEFAKLSSPEKEQICAEICSTHLAKGSLREPSAFFAVFRSLVMGGFYSTPQGFKDVGYVGNTPLTKFDGPPPEVLTYLKLPAN